MGENSKIEWTHHTFNPWRGCTKVAQGCAHCYADAMSVRNPKTLGVWGPNGTRVMAAPKAWQEPLKWDKAAAAAGERHRVFCASLADVFEDWHGAVLSHRGKLLVTFPTDGISEDNDDPDDKDEHRLAELSDVRAQLFALIDATPNLDWLLLTKRPENILRMWPRAPHKSMEGQKGKRYNVWLGTSISDQATADKNVPELLKCRDLSPVLFLSAEPLLGPIDLEIPWEGEAELPTVQVDWVIVGGESGHNARPMHPQWASEIRDQCQDADVPFFFKQWGEWQPNNHGPVRAAAALRIDTVGREVTNLPGLWDEADEYFYKVGKKEAGRKLGGSTWNEFPEVIR